MENSKIIIMSSIALALACGVTVFYNFLTAGEALSEDKISWIKENPIAHRGLYTENIPENSLGAFENAVKNNYVIELDVQFTKDKEVVVFHDENLKRMTNDTRNIEDVNYDELKNLRLGKTNERIPTLEEVLELVDNKVAILIEIKDCKDYIKLSEKTYKILKGYEGKYAIQSFNPFILQWYKNNASEVIRGQLSGTFTEGSENLNALEKFALKNLLLNFKSKPNYIGYELEGIPKSKLENLRKKGVPIIIWTVKNKEAMEKAYKYSDNIIQKNYKNIMKVINIKLPKELKEKYKHRDYLSSLIRLGIKREKIGDIIVQDQEADIIILKEISEYVKTNIVELTRFKKSIVEIVEINKISKAKTKREKIQLIVSSLRLDNLVKELTNTSRNKAEEIILKGRVFVNFENILKLSKILKQGDIVTIRGKGRFQIIEEIGNTRKDKKIIEIEKYV